MNKNKGRVSLVGAGPGDPGLLTLKALERIRQADLIVYDYLANPDHLRHAKRSAAKIGVGMGFRHKPRSQEKINRLILGAVRRGRNVVRLKGGDPYLFGRGGEEALFLFQNKIPFEVVPGVTSAVACAAYAGIPLTHREHNSSVTFLTGHKAHDEHLDSVPWEKIVALDGTLVIYMGFYNLADIVEKLVRYGMKSGTRVSVIEWGTLPRQKSCDGTLETIQKKVAAKQMKPPAIIIIGEVVSLKTKLNWYEKLPWFGKRVVITRSRDKADALCQKLEALGAQVLEFPLIEIRPVSNPRPMDEAVKNILKYDWLIFTSTYGVEAFFDRLRLKGRDARALATAKIACVGPGTGAELLKHGVRADLQPGWFETAAIVEEFRKRFKRLSGTSVLLLRTDIAPPGLEQGLRRLGADVDRVTAYETHFVKRVSAEIKKALLSGRVDVVTFTSSSTVEGFMKIFGRAGFKKIALKTKLASIGPVTSGTLKRYGLRPFCEAKVFTIEGLVDVMTETL